jgi:hypothetical protein
MGDVRSAYKILVGKPEGRPRYRREVNIKMKTGRCGLDLFDLRQRSASGCCEHGNELSGSIKRGKLLE